MTNPTIERDIKEAIETVLREKDLATFEATVVFVLRQFGISLYNQGQMDALGGLRVSWDIADNGKEWIVQFWRKDLDGTMTLVTQLDKNSDDGGSFDLSHIASLKEQTHAQI